MKTAKEIISENLAKQGVTPRAEKVKEKKANLTKKRIEELTLRMLTDFGYIE